MKLLKLLIVIAVAANLNACKKDKEQDQSNDRLLGTWKLSSIQSGSLNLTDFPFFSCFKDNTITLNNDKTYRMVEGNDVCEPAWDGSGTWSLTGNNKKLQFIDENGENLILDVVEITNNTFTIVYQVTDLPSLPDMPLPISGSVNITFQKQ